MSFAQYILLATCLLSSSSSALRMDAWNRNGTRSAARKFNEEAAAIANSNSNDVSAPADFAKQTGNWCSGGCHTNFEKTYLSEHAAELQEGLAALHGWRCVPESQTVVAAGYFRTGSTLLYNVARLWLELALPGKLATGYGCHGHDAGPGATLCKEHLVSTELAEKANVLLMSHRDVHATVCSRLAFQARNGSPPSAAVASKECKELRKQQAAVYTSMATVGKRVAHDVLTTESGLDEAEFTAVARALGICESAATNPQLLIFMKNMAERLLSHPDESSRITQMHASTAEDTKQDLCSNLSDWIAEDAECAQWAAESGGVHANSFAKVKVDGNGF